MFCTTLFNSVNVTEEVTVSVLITTFSLSTYDAVNATTDSSDKIEYDAVSATSAKNARLDVAENCDTLEYEEDSMFEPDGPTKKTTFPRPSNTYSS
jgi:hypothetical protein